MEFYETEDATNEQWGTKTDNDSYTGLIAEMVDEIEQKFTFRNICIK